MAGPREIEQLRTADGGLWLASASGKVRISRVASSVVRLDMEGHFCTDFFLPCTDLLDRVVVEQGHLFMAVDAEGLGNYDPRSRYLWAEWIKAHLGALDGLLALAGNPVVRIAIVVINAVTGVDVIQTRSHRDEFEDELHAAVVAARRMQRSGGT